MGASELRMRLQVVWIGETYTFETQVVTHDLLSVVKGFFTNTLLPALKELLGPEVVAFISDMAARLSNLVKDLVNRFVKLPQCLADTHCASTQYCQNRELGDTAFKCLDKTPNGGECSKDAQCQSGFCDCVGLECLSNQGTCASKSQLGETCARDGDDDSCHQGTCRSALAPGSGGRKKKKEGGGGAGRRRKKKEEEEKKKGERKKKKKKKKFFFF